VNLGSLLQAPGQLASSRFFRVAYLPTCAGVIYLLVLIWAGAPGHRVHFGNAWRTASHLGIGEIVLLAIGITLVAVVVQPFQLALVRVLEGNFPGSGKALKCQLCRKKSLATKRREAIDKASNAADELLKAIDKASGLPEIRKIRRELDGFTQDAGVASERLRLRYPRSDYVVRATGLGNALAAMEDTVGAGYGLDPVVTWPRLYPLLSDPVRAAVDDFRDSLDAAARLAATSAIAALATIALLAWHSEWWTSLALVPLAVAVVSYLATIPAAIGYGLAMQVAFDLHRFDLLRAMHLEEPDSAKVEKASNADLPAAEEHFTAALTALDQPLQPTYLTPFERAEIRALAMAALDRGQEATAILERAVSERSGADVFQRQHYELFSASGLTPGINALIAIWRDIIASDNSAVGPWGGPRT
jgi:hypothetical protein